MNELIKRNEWITGWSIGVSVPVVALSFAGCRRPGGGFHQTLKDLVVGVRHVVRQVIISNRRTSTHHFHYGNQQTTLIHVFNSTFVKLLGF